MRKAFYNTNVTKKVSIFNEAILNVLSNYISRVTLTCNDKNPPWFNSQIKSLLQDKNKLYKDFQRSNTNAQLFHKLNYLQDQLNFLINRSKQYHYARMTKNKFVTDFKEKAELFNSHFATHGSLISNSSKLPSHI